MERAPTPKDVQAAISAVVRFEESRGMMSFVGPQPDDPLVQAFARHGAEQRAAGREEGHALLASQEHISDTVHAALWKADAALKQIAEAPSALDGGSIEACRRIARTAIRALGDRREG